MVTYFNKKDLVSFGNYLMSERRRDRFEATTQSAIQVGGQNIVPTDERLKKIYHADIENWLEEQR